MNEETLNAVKAALIAGNPQLAAQLIFDTGEPLDIAFTHGTPVAHNEGVSGIRWAVGIFRLLGNRGWLWGTFGISTMLMVAAGFAYRELIQRVS